MLRRENELLKQTINEATSSIGGLEASLEAANVPVPGSVVGVAAVRAAEDLKPEDFWSPSIEVPDGYEYVDEYGPISPIPGHDGTECFKWDDTLWSKAEHFKVRDAVCNRAYSSHQVQGEGDVGPLPCALLPPCLGAKIRVPAYNTWKQSCTQLFAFLQN